MVKKILSRKDLIKKAPQIHRFHWNSMTYGAIEIEIENWKIENTDNVYLELLSSEQLLSIKAPKQRQQY